eukprot:TRINITY_DN2818_c0_g1_i1.p1 TRINITY_DN2818_c0_g1~~TRINITY_DN2818_c0_g1_i1.p1  ORF type:complete len:203 (-),score=51.10 TRINITY_DN2818_c0_g1_i1:4-579(-)
MRETNEKLKAHSIVRFLVGTSILTGSFALRHRTVPMILPKAGLIGAAFSATYTGIQFGLSKLNDNKHNQSSDIIAGTTTVAIWRNLLFKPPLAPLPTFCVGAGLGFVAFQTEDLIRSGRLKNISITEIFKNARTKSGTLVEAYTELVDDVIFALPWISPDPALREVSREFRAQHRNQNSTNADQPSKSEAE